MLIRPKPNSKNYKQINSFSAKLLPAAVVASALLFGCSNKTNIVERNVQCKETFAKIETEYEKKRYVKMREHSEFILEHCRGTGFIEQTQFMIAESHFRKKEWIEARGEYNTFVYNFPSSPYAETAAYRKAVSSFHMSSNDMRDDTPTRKSQQDFEDFVLNFPNSLLRDSAMHYQALLVDRSAEREYQIARLYWRMDEPLAATIYLKSILDYYPRTSRLFDVYAMLIDSYILIEHFEQAEYYIDEFKLAFNDEKQAWSSREKNLETAKKRVNQRIEKERKKKLLIRKDGA
ncbi:MAG: outer membrane protein assembly factor BamD [Fibrobacter sp.]|nr:outer membrane protein assembly factor BamD [Fibrobacter sp.]